MQVPNCVKNFFAYVQTQFQGVIKHLRTDNGTEFFQDYCTQLFRELGVIPQRSAPKTPQQNGRV